MSYLLLDDAYGGHQKISGLPVHAKWLHTCALLHCAEKLTDGVVTRHALQIVAATAEIRPGKHVQSLVARGLWDETEDGWIIHDYLDHNPSAAEVKAKRKVRAEAGKRGGLASGLVRSKTEANASPTVEPHPIPSHPMKEHSQPLTNYGDDPDENGGYNHALERVIAACGNTTDARQKLAADALELHVPEARLLVIEWAITQNGTHDRLGKARSMMRTRASDT
jgi:hypothetical protein